MMKMKNQWELINVISEAYFMTSVDRSMILDTHAENEIT